MVKQKRVPGTEFVRKRSENFNIPLNMSGWGMNITRKIHLGMELLVKQTLGRKVFFGKTAGRNNVRKLAPRTEFVDKRSLGMEFIGKRAHRMQIVDKRGPGMEFVGKRSLKQFLFARK